MPYTPPAGHAVNFGFTVSGYVPPAGHAVNFGFSATTPPSAPPSGALLFTGFAPGVSQAALPASGAITVTGFAPRSDITVAPAAGVISFTGYAPAPIANAVVSPASGAITFTGFAPAPLANVVVSPANGAISFTGYAPAPIAGIVVTPAAGAISFTGYAPTLIAGIVVSPISGAISFTGFAPRGDEDSKPSAGLLNFTGFNPTPVNMRPLATVSLAELFFDSTASFVDFSLAANRRKFISEIGGAPPLRADGSTPFSVTPPVYLAAFGNNAGRGGHFTLTGTVVAGASKPPPVNTSTTTPNPGSLGRGVLGDYRTGNLYAFNPANLTDDGTARRWLRRWRALAQTTEAAQRFSELAVDMQTGIGVPDGTHPHVSLRWSDDGGHTWSDERIMGVGRLGSTIKTVKFNRLGSTRRFKPNGRVFELSSDDPFLVAILGADVEGG